MAFIVTGALGLSWLAFGWFFTKLRARNRWLRPEEMPDVQEAAVSSKGARPNWKRIITMRECYTLILARFFTDPVLYFVIFWLPEYLRKERGFRSGDGRESTRGCRICSGISGTSWEGGCRAG